ncbi:MAG: hypothetical protein EOO10_14345 [Chitinophagaceae bacterium]|nr:MAG: hypothetical protein EOO10_14345 [Chitinophagaceae bacterium]
MTNQVKNTILLFCALLLSFFCYSQTDTTKGLVQVDTLIKNSPPIQNKAKADSVRKAFSPKKATIRSAILPGWGQFYNKKYWKIPIVYGALGVSAGVFFYNITNYREIRFAYKTKYNLSRVQSPTLADSADYLKIEPTLVRIDVNSLRSLRDEFRSNIDYSVLAFILLWGLNVVDATVDAHLKAFDVSPDLSFKIKFGPSQMAGTTGLSFVLAVRNKSDRK